MASDNVCKTCQKKVQSFSYKICCMNCKITYHAKCVHLDKDDIHNVNFWYCSYCLGDILVYNHIDDDNEFYSTILEGMLDCPFNVHEMSKKVFIPFEINDEFDTPLTEIDPDMQFYLESNYIKNTKCDYYIEDTFVKNISKIQKQKRALSMFHVNIKSLPKHFDELQQYLHMLAYDFSLIGISETWLNENNVDLYDLNGYVTIKDCRKERRGGGVSLYIRDEISFATRNDLGYFDSEMESIFIEIDKDIQQYCDWIDL